MKNIAITIAFLSLLALPASASFVEGGKREFPLACNGVPCVIDSASSSVYCSVKPVEGDSINLVFTSDSIPYVLINYKRYYMGDTVRLINKFTRTFKLRFGKITKAWTLRLTSLPIVMIEASQYEHDAYHHGYINILDPWKRTKGQAHFQHFIGARIRGAHTAGLAKKPYAIKLWNSNREGKNISVLGMMKDDNLILDAMYNDKARMRTRLSFDLWNRVDSIPYDVSEGHSKLNGTEGHYVEVFVDGAYNGVYCLTDKINRRKLDLVKVEADDSGTLTHHGMLYKATGWSDETMFNNVSSSANTNATLWWREWEQKYPDDSVQMANWNPLKNLIKLTAPKTNTNNNQFAAQFRLKYYMQNVADFILLINLLHINDNNCKNTYVSFRDVDETLSRRALITPWDLDASWGRNWDGAKLDTQGWGSQVSNCGLFNRLVNGGPSYFRECLHDTWIRWKNGVFSLDSVKARILDKKEQLVSSGAWNREVLRWPNSTETIDTETQYMIEWYARAMSTADSILADFPSGIDDVRAAIDETLHVGAVDGCVCVYSDTGTPKARVSIYSADGALIEGGDETLPYRSGNLERGIYIVNVKTAEGTLRQKLIIR